MNEATQSRKQTYTEGVEREVDALDVRINALKARLGEVQSEAKIIYQRKLDDLQERRETLESQMEALQESGEDAWEDLRAGVDQALADLKRGITEIVAR